MKKILLSLLLILGLTSCSEEPLQSNEVKPNIYSSKVVYKNTEIVDCYKGAETAYILLLDNDVVVEAKLPDWFKINVGDTVYYVDSYNDGKPSDIKYPLYKGDVTND